MKGLNRLYFLYEAYDNYWDFSRPDLHNDTFEVVVDADLSGGPLIDEMHPNKQMNRWDAYFSFHGVHAQNYHIFTPHVGKDWCMAWGAPSWTKELPWANAAQKFDQETRDCVEHQEAHHDLPLEFFMALDLIADDEDQDRRHHAVNLGGIERYAGDNIRPDPELRPIEPGGESGEDIYSVARLCVNYHVGRPIPEYWVQECSFT